MSDVRAVDGAVEVLSANEVLRVEPWGADSVRVRAARRRILDDLPGALLPPKPCDAEIRVGEADARVTNGAITAVVQVRAGEEEVEVNVRFERTADGTELLAEQRAHFWWPGARLFAASAEGASRVEQRFRAYDGERIFGLGQRTHGALDQKGHVLDLVQRNGEVTIPFALSSRGYGLLWNLPAVGRVEFADNGTRWVADRARQIDYWVTAGRSPANILSNYADATGHPPRLPRWATGFWQSKLRYRTQEELLSVVREHVGRGLPLSVIVVDFFHWTRLGDWRFDPADWPDPPAMIEELERLGVRLLVSIWPSVNPLSENYDEMSAKGYLIGTEQGLPFHARWRDKGLDKKLPVAFYDATNPAARRYIWSKVKRNYFDLGARAWWLDACEPEIQPGDVSNLNLWAGPGAETALIYPMEHARGFFEGMHEAGADDVVLLCRSAWAGSQRYGAAVWSGDIPPTWESLRAQIRAGLNIALSGIPWWTTDVGGFHGGDPESPEYRELLVRWFSYGALCPLFRLHGYREPRQPLGPEMHGGPNEVWSYGEQAYGHLVRILQLRERLRPYLDAQMETAHETGVPPMRPLFVDFPDDARCWDVEDQFLLGPDLLVAPVLEPGVNGRMVYLPSGARWTPAGTAHPISGGQSIDVEAPLGSIPLFLRDNASLPLTE